MPKIESSLYIKIEVLIYAVLILNIPWGNSELAHVANLLFICAQKQWFRDVCIFLLFLLNCFYNLFVVALYFIIQ